MHTYLVSLGSNFNADFNMRVGSSLLSVCFPKITFSCVLRTKGIGLSYDCWYLNRMAKIISSLDFVAMSRALKEIERQMARQHRSRYVTFDLDLVKIDGEIVHKDYNKYPFLSQLGKEVESNIDNKVL